MHTSPNFTDRLWTFVQGNADAELEHHLQVCEECQEEHAALVGLTALRSAKNLPPVTDTLTSSLNGLLKKVRPDLVRTISPKPGFVQRAKSILASLILDTSMQPQVAGLRGETRTRQIAFVSDVADLDLEVSQQDQHLLVVGQLGMDEVPSNLNLRFVPADADPLTDEPDSARTTSISDHGHFRLTVEPGSWVAAVDIEDVVVLFPGIEL